MCPRLAKRKRTSRRRTSRCRGRARAALRLNEAPLRKQAVTKLFFRPCGASFISHFSPGLAPWAAFLSRFAAFQVRFTPLSQLGLEFRNSRLRGGGFLSSLQIMGCALTARKEPAHAEVVECASWDVQIRKVVWRILAD